MQVRVHGGENCRAVVNTCVFLIYCMYLHIIYVYACKLCITSCLSSHIFHILICRFVSYSCQRHQIIHIHICAYIAFWSAVSSYVSMTPFSSANLPNIYLYVICMHLLESNDSKSLTSLIHIIWFQHRVYTYIHVRMLIYVYIFSYISMRLCLHAYSIRSCRYSHTVGK